MKSQLWIVLICLMGLSTVQAQNFTPIQIDEDIQLLQLKDSVFVHITWHSLPSIGRFSSNGMLYIKNGEAVMVDTPMDNDKTEKLLNYLRDKMSVNVKMLIIGHFHDDCMGGLAYIKSQGIKSIALDQTVAKCKELGLPLPLASFKDSLQIDFFGEMITCRYFGPGHSFDNIVVHIPSQKVLFGGCLIKAKESRGLGNLSDAVLHEWAATVLNIQNTYKDLDYIIPGHGTIGDASILEHTLTLVENYITKE